MHHKNIGEEKHDHSDGEDREIGDDVSDPAAEGLGAGHDVLEEDDGGEDHLNNDGDVGLKKLVDKFGITIDNGEDDNDLQNNGKRSEDNAGKETNPLGDVDQNRNKAGGDGADGNDGGDNPGDKNAALAGTGPDG